MRNRAAGRLALLPRLPFGLSAQARVYLDDSLWDCTVFNSPFTHTLTGRGEEDATR